MISDGFLPEAALVVLVALVVDAVTGEPEWLYRRLPHPVVLIGRTIAALEARWNRADRPDAVRRLLGGAVVVLVVGGAVLIGWAVQALLLALPLGWLWLGIVASSLIAARSLYDHVRLVAEALDTGSLEAARGAVSRIVGRDPNSLEAAGVARAAVESTAENFSDGVLAPLLWLALFGLPGLVAYKAINTLDSMIGHRSPRYRAFGWAAARLDDLANLLPARLAALCLALVGVGASGHRLRTVLAGLWRDAGNHASPNAGWPEAAMAYCLGLALAGPRRYGDRIVEDPWINPAARRDAGAADIRAALAVMVRAAMLGGAVCALIAAWAA